MTTPVKMGVVVKVINAGEIATRFDGDARSLFNTAEKAVARAGEILIGSARQQFVGERTRALFVISGGRVRRRKTPRAITSPPSKLGVFEGTYRRAISQEASRRGKTFITEVGPVGIPYAVAHEFGLPSRNLPARPVLTPALKESSDKIVLALGGALDVIR